MEILTLDVPAMYGDHHVVEVRRILLEISGVEDVYASSSFHTVEVRFDPAQVNEDAIKEKLEVAGYLEDLLVPLETGLPVYGRNGDSYFRHTTAYEQTKQVVGFAQSVSYSGRPLWPCPGMGAVSDMDE
jgi:copper chaperone CopZ